MLGNVEGAAVAIGNLNRHYIVIQSGAKEGEGGGVAEEMEPGGRELQEVEKRAFN